MEQSDLNQILEALKMYSGKIYEKIDGLDTRIGRLETRVDGFETEMNNRFDRLDAKFGGLRAEFTETQETVDYLSRKNAQHESKLRKATIRN